MLTFGTCMGGINADGAFWCGGQSSAVDSLLLITREGRFTANGGTPVGFEAREEVTFVAPVDGVPSDCDLRLQIASTFFRTP